MPLGINQSVSQSPAASICMEEVALSRAVGVINGCEAPCAQSPHVFSQTPSLPPQQLAGLPESL